MGITLLMEQSISENLDSKVVKVPIVPKVTQHLAVVRRKNVEHTSEKRFDIFTNYAYYHK